MAKNKFSFQTKLTVVNWQLLKHIILLPDDVIAQLPDGRLRCKGTLNNKTDFNLAIQYRKTGERFIAISGILMKAAQIKLNTMFTVSFVLVDKDLVEIPEELEALLEQDEEASVLWKSFSSAWQRGFAHYVASVKNPDSRIKRAIQIMEKAKHGQLNAQLEKKKKEEFKK